MKEIRRLSREVLYQGRVIDLLVDQVEYPSGRRGVREIAKHPGGGVTVPLLDDGRVLLVKQLRYPFDSHIVELPAGKLTPGEDPAEAAARELAEETGYHAGVLEHLATIYTSPGICDEQLFIYLARGLTPLPEGARREEGELTMTVLAVPFAEAVELAVRGELRDAKTVAGLLLADRKLHGDPTHH